VSTTTGSTTAEVTGSQIANVNHPTHPKFQDFGDMMVHGNGGAGYVSRGLVYA